MCDCYRHKCDAGECVNVIPMHLGDYMTRRGEIAVYCDEHWSAIYGWTGIEPFCRAWAYYVMPKEGRPRIDICGIKYKTDNAWERKDMNHPNAGVMRVLEEI